MKEKKVSHEKTHRLRGRFHSRAARSKPQISARIRLQDSQTTGRVNLDELSGTPAIQKTAPQVQPALTPRSSKLERESEQYGVEYLGNHASRVLRRPTRREQCSVVSFNPVAACWTAYRRLRASRCCTLETLRCVHRVPEGGGQGQLEPWCRERPQKNNKQHPPQTVPGADGRTGGRTGGRPLTQISIETSHYYTGQHMSQRSCRQISKTNAPRPSESRLLRRSKVLPRAARCGLPFWLVSLSGMKLGRPGRSSATSGTPTHAEFHPICCACLGVLGASGVPVVVTEIPRSTGVQGHAASTPPTASREGQHPICLHRVPHCTLPSDSVL